MSQEILVSVADFRNIFKEYEDTGKYPDALIESYIEQAGCYCSTLNYGILNGKCRKLAIELMAAHLFSLDNLVESESDSENGIVTSATIDQVNVNFAPPPLGDNDSAWWYNQTPYGRRYRNLLKAKVPVGVYVGGSFQRNYKGNIINTRLGNQ